MTDQARVYEQTVTHGDAAAAARLRQRAVEHPVHQLQRLVGNHAVYRMLAEHAPEEVPADLARTIDNARGGGEPLAGDARKHMESAFGTDFSHVRIHRDAEADASARALDARAFTTGSHVFFSRGAYDPGSTAGKELLAHELTHVVQQTGRPVSAKLEVAPPGDALEQEADDVARDVVSRDVDAARREDGAPEAHVLLGGLGVA